MYIVNTVNYMNESRFFLWHCSLIVCTLHCIVAVERIYCKNALSFKSAVISVFVIGLRKNCSVLPHISVFLYLMYISVWHSFFQKKYDDDDDGTASRCNNAILSPKKSSLFAVEFIPCKQRHDNCLTMIIFYMVVMVMGVILVVSLSLGDFLCEFCMNKYYIMIVWHSSLLDPRYT